MRTTTIVALSLAGSLALGLAPRAAFAADKNDETESTTKKAKSHAHHAEPRHTNNTGVNKRDRNSDEPTTGQQTNHKRDEKLTAEIRRAITEDKTLSFSSRNVKVITHDGKVTLKGPVASRQEKRSIEEKAEHVAGAGAVTSELEVEQQ